MRSCRDRQTFKDRHPLQRFRAHKIHPEFSTSLRSTFIKSSCGILVGFRVKGKIWGPRLGAESLHLLAASMRSMWRSCSCEIVSWLQCAQNPPPLVKIRSLTATSLKFPLSFRGSPIHSFKFTEDAPAIPLNSLQRPRQVPCAASFGWGGSMCANLGFAESVGR